MSGTYGILYHSIIIIHYTTLQLFFNRRYNNAAGEMLPRRELFGSIIRIANSKRFYVLSRSRPICRALSCKSCRLQVPCQKVHFTMTIKATELNATEHTDQNQFTENRFSIGPFGNRAQDVLIPSAPNVNRGHLNNINILLTL